MAPWKLAALILLSAALASTACKKKEAPLPSPYWVEVEVRVDARFDVLKIRQFTLVVDSVTPEGPALELPDSCGALITSGPSSACSSTCEDYDNDGHREFIVDCTGESGTLLNGRVWNYLLFGDPAVNATPFKLRSYIRGEAGLLGSGEITADIKGNPIAISAQGNPRVRLNIACIPLKSCSTDLPSQCQLDISGAASPTVNEGVDTSFTYSVSGGAAGEYNWDIKMDTGADAPHWVTLSSVDETHAHLGFSPPVGAASQSGLSMLLQVADATCSKTLPLNVTIRDVNQAPTLTELGVLTVQAGVSSTFYLAAYDPDVGDTLNYILSGSPAWAVVQPVSGSPPRRAWLRISPPAGTTGTFGPITLTVKDSGNPALSDSIAFTVKSMENLDNHAPVLYPVGNLTASSGTTVNIPLSAYDPDSQNTLTFMLQNEPGWASLTGQNGSSANLRLSPPMGVRADWPGMTIRVADQYGAADQETVTIMLNRALSWPSLSPVADHTVEEGSATPLQIQLEVTDADVGESFFFGMSNQPHWVVLDDGNPGDTRATLNIHPPSGSAGIHSNIIVIVHDSKGLADWKRFNLTVLDSNAKPRLSAIGNRICPPGQVTEVPLWATDADGEVVTFSLSEGAPGWASLVDGDLSDNRAKLRCEPPRGTAGIFDVSVIARDVNNASVHEEMKLLVDMGCSAPRMSTVGRKYLYAGESRRIDLRAVDDDQGDTLSFSLHGAESWIALADHGDGTAHIDLEVPLSWQSGEFIMGAIMVRDSCQHVPIADTAPIELVIGRANQCPLFHPLTAQSIMEGSQATLDIRASDLDSESSTLSLDPITPSWVSIDSFNWNGQEGSGTLILKPPLGSSGEHGVILVLTENRPQSPCVAVAMLEVRVAPWQNHPPRLTPAASQTLRESSTLLVGLSATDSDAGQTLTFEAGAGCPSWAEVSGSGSGGEGVVSQGTLRLTPGFGEQGLHTVMVRLTDGMVTVDEPVQVTVLQGLQAPGGVSAEDGVSTGHVKIYWDSVIGAGGYRVFRAESSPGDFLQQGTVLMSPYQDNSALPGIRYHYKVQAYSSQWSSEGRISSADQGYRALAAPSGLSASDGASSAHVALSWNSVLGADSYRLYRSLSAAGPFAELDSSNATSYLDGSAVPLTQYYYKVRAYALSSESLSGFSSDDAGHRGFPVPQGVAASDGTFTAHTAVSWNSVAGADGYFVHRSESLGGTYSPLGSLPATSYLDSTAIPGKLYFYKVQAYASSTSTYSAFSDVDSGYRGLSAPANLQATDGAHTNKVVLSWTGVEGADAYQVYRSPTAQGEYGEIGTAASALYEDLGAAPGKVFYYKVGAKAQSSSSQGPLSLSDGGHLKLSTPQNVVASDGTYTDKVVIGWSPISGAERYYLYRSTEAAGTYTELSSSVTTSFNDESALVGTHYYYKVRAQAAAVGFSDYSTYASGFKGLNTPGNLTATQGTSTSHVGLGWDSVSGSDKYYLYRSTEAEGMYSELVSLVATSYEDTSAAPGVRYFYRVRSYSTTHGMSAFSSTASGYRGLPVPGGFSASDGTSAAAVEVTWIAVEGASSYIIYRSASETGGHVEHGSTATTIYKDTTTIPGMVYYYKVQAHADAIPVSSAFSNQDSGYRKLSPPAGLTASTGTLTDKVALSWNLVSGADHYNLFRASGSEGPYDQLGGNIATASYNDLLTEPGIRYYYKVRAHASSSNTYSSDSEYAQGYRRLLNPENLQAGEGTSTEHVPLSWGAVQGANSYQVHRATTDEGAFVEVGNSALITYNDVLAVPGKLYFYKARAYAASSESYGDFSGVTQGYRMLPAPSNLSATDGILSDLVALSWSSVTGAHRYYLYRAASASGDYALLSQPAGISYSDTSAVPGVRYYYKVRAYSESSGSFGQYSGPEEGYRGLAAPDGISAGKGTSLDHVQVTWNGTAGTTSYHLFRGAAAEGAYSEIGATTGLSYVDVLAFPGEKYYYKVRAFADSSQTYSAWSGHDYGYCALSVPQGVVASDGSVTAHVNITWNGVNGATSYQVWRSSSAGGAYSTIGNASSTFHDDSTAVPGIVYYYKIRAYAASSGSVSDYSAHDDGYRKVAPPSGVAAEDGVDTGRIRLSWSAAEGASRYHVHRSDSENGTYGELTSVTATSYDDLTAEPGRLYHYKVRTYAAPTDTYSALSASDSGYRKLAAPQGLAAGDGLSTSQVALSWSGVTGADTYQVFRSPAIDGIFSQLGETAETTYGDRGITPGLRYYYKVKAHAASSASFSDFSDPDSGYGQLTTPGGINATDGASPSHVEVTFETVAGADKYHIYRSTTAGGEYSNIGNTATLSYQDISASPGVLYYYQVKAFADSSESYSASSAADQGYRSLMVPSGLAASDGLHGDKVAVTWNAVTGADRYYIYRAEDAEGPYSQVGSYVTFPAFDDFTVTAVINYYYKVRAYAASSNSFSSYSSADIGSILRHILYIDFQGDAGGTVREQGSGQSCTDDCQLYMVPDASVVLEASWDEGSVEFTGWNRGGCYGQGNCSFQMTRQREVAAVFRGKKNYIFTTSITYVPGVDFDSLASADEICGDRALKGGLPGTYVAWLSDESVDAKARLGSARGWVRPDGRPFADSVADLLSGEIFMPPVLDEYGKGITSEIRAWTGTSGDGTRRLGFTCTGWSGSGGVATGGSCTSTTDDWTDNWIYFCNEARRLYCFGTDYANPVIPPKAGGWLAFVTTGTFQADGSLSGADALCQSEADGQGLSGTFLALLATDTASAASRFSPIGPGWVRPDGIRITDTAALLLAGGPLLAPINVQADGVTYSSLNIWTGASSPAVAEPGNTCQSWTSAATGEARRGSSPDTDTSWFSFSSPWTCSSPLSLYCLGDNRTNVAFVTSRSYAVGSAQGFASLADADARCNERAAAAGLSGAFVAWLSDSATDAKARLGPARGWVRPDGRPFADSVADLTARRVFHPLLIDELGNALSAGETVWTGTYATGLKASGSLCNDWASGSGGLSAVVGTVVGGPDAWTWHDSASGGCDGQRRLYCLGVGRDNPVAPVAEAGRLAFLTREGFTPGGGLAAADALCQSEAVEAGLKGSFLALLSTEQAGAATRFSSSGPLWVRPDGVPLAASAAELFGGGWLRVPLSVTADGTAYRGNELVWTGSQDPNTAGSSVQSCSSWSSGSGATQGRAGRSGLIDINFYSAIDLPCSSKRPIYCLEE